MKRILVSLILVIGFAGLSLAQSSGDIKVKATGFTLKNTENGMRQATPEVMLWNTSNASVNTTVSYLLYNPEGVLVTKSGDYSSQKEAELRPGQNKVELSNLWNCRAALFTEGTYSYKVNVNGEMVCQGNIIYGTQPAPAVNVQPENPVVQVQPEVKEEPKVEPKVEQPVVYNDQPVHVAREPKPQPEPMKLHFGLYGGIAMGSFSLSADGVMGSVVDYSLTALDEFKTFENPNYQFGMGFTGGLFVQVPLLKGKNLYMEAGAQFSHYSYTNEFSSKKFSTPDFNLWLNGESVAFMMDYDCNESYTLNMVNVPVMFGYEFAITPLFHIDLATGPVLNVIATADLAMKGHSNCDAYEYGVYYGQAKSDITGNADLMTGVFHINQKFSTGDGGSYNLTNDGSDPTYAAAQPVYNRIGASWRIGANIGVGPVSLFANYDLPLTNMANDAYWNTANGTRIPGLILFGNSFYSEAPIKGYKQKLGVFTAGLSVRF